MDHVNRLAAQQPQTAEFRASFIEMKYIGEHARRGVTAIKRDGSRIGKPCERLGKTPDFRLRHNADLLAGLKQRAGIARPLWQGRAERRRTSRRRGQSQPADLMHEVHIVLRPFEALGSPRIVIDNPLGEADRAFNRHAKIGDSFAEVLERAGLAPVSFQFIDPWFERLVAGLAGDLDQFNQRQLLAAEVLVFSPILGSGR